MGAYRKLVEDVIALGGRLGVDLRYWSAWNEPNHPFFDLAPARGLRCASPSLAVERYAELTRNLKRALDEAPETSSTCSASSPASTRARPRVRRSRSSFASCRRPIVCGSTILSQHGYITGIDPSASPPVPRRPTSASASTSCG